MELCETRNSWFAMRATYGRNLMVQRILEVNKIESFAGIYDGNDRTISNMNYQGSNTSNYTNVGLFSF